jgi:hypothetical protein
MGRAGAARDAQPRRDFALPRPRREEGRSTRVVHGVHPVTLERNRAVARRVNLGALVTAKDDRLTVEREIHREHQRATADDDAHAAQRTAGEQAQAFVPIELLQPGAAIDPIAHNGIVARSRPPDQGPWSPIGLAHESGDVRSFRFADSLAANTAASVRRSIPNFASRFDT